MHGAGGIGNYQHLLQLKQSQGSITNPNTAGIQSAVQRQPQGAQTGGSGPALLLNLSRNGEDSSTGTCVTTPSSTSQENVIGKNPSEKDTSGTGTSGDDRQYNKSVGAGSPGGPSSPAYRRFAQNNKQGNGSTPPNGATTNSAARESTGSSGKASFLQRAISKYMQFSPEGVSSAQKDSVVVTA